MKTFKFGTVIMAALIILSSCGASNTTKGGLIGGGSGAAVGALIGKKMDKAKAAAEAVENAKVESVKDANGLDAIKMTFDSGILFTTGSATLSAEAKKNLNDFTNNVLKVYTDCDVAIQGYTDNQGWKNSTAEQSAQKNLTLSQNRADAVKSYLLSAGAAATQIKSSTGFGQANPVADNSTKAGQEQNRRVEVYLYASEAMIKAANEGTLK